MRGIRGTSVATLSLILFFCSAADAVRGQDEGAVRAKRLELFSKLDADNDQRLSLEEYQRRSGDPKVHRRDFLLFDMTEDNSLSRAEFSAIPGIGRPVDRGYLNDPFEGLLQQAVDAMDQAYDGWDLRPEEQMNSTFFAINFSASLATDNRRRLDREIVAQADANSDHMISRDEAKRFLQIQLGMRWTNDELLRLGNGRVVNYSLFMAIDTNANDVLTRKEFMDRWWRKATAEKDFATIDRNGDDEISLSEFAAPTSPGLTDVVINFRRWDTNLDAQLDREELTESVPTYRANLIPSSLRAFDADGNDKLSLNEYRLSMLGNLNYPWQSLPKDGNGDGYLSFEEFVFHPKRNLFQLQRRFYFHRLDANRDKKLSIEEFEFQGKKLHSLVAVSLDTGKVKDVYRRREFPSCGSPSVSPDGKWIAFDATPNEGISRTRIMKMSPDGSNVHNLCDGLMPTWSPDGKQFACSRYEGGSGVWIMNADGTPEKRIADGWGAQWSPDGKTIAYSHDNRLLAYDVESEKTRVVLAKDAHPYQYLFWNMAWSPDSRQLALKGRLPGRQEIAVVSMTGEAKLRTFHSSEKQIAADLAWTHDGKSLVFNLLSEELKRPVLYQFSPDGDVTLRPFEGFDDKRAVGSVCFSADGKWLVLSCRD